MNHIVFILFWINSNVLEYIHTRTLIIHQFKAIYINKEFMA